MSRARNAVLIVMFLLLWIYLYVPNPYVSFLDTGEKAEPISNDLLLFYIPAFLGALAYVAHVGRWPVRLGLAISPPFIVVVTVFSFGTIGVMSKEGAGWTLIFVMLAVRTFVVTLAIAAAIVEIANRGRKLKKERG